MRESVLTRRGQFIRTLLAASLATEIEGGAKSGKPAELTLSDLEGGRVHLRDYRGKILVLNFWATWCGPCKHEMPMMVAAEKVYASRGVIFVGASLDDTKTKSRIPEFLNKFNITFPVWTGASAADLAKLSMGPAVPATAFIDEVGRIVARVSGEMQKGELDERLEWLLGDRSRPAPPAFVQHLDSH